jgi:RNA polymerase sigma-B factor
VVEPSANRLHRTKGTSVTTTTLTRPTPDPGHCRRSVDLLDTPLDELLESLADHPSPEERSLLLDAAVRSALPLADALARQYGGRGIEGDDLQQVARTALVAAVQRYRPGGGRGFEAFAVPTIRGELKRHFRDCGWAVRPPRRLQELRAELSAAEEALRHRLGREVTDAELADALACATTEVEDARRCGSGYRPGSLDAPTPTGDTLASSLPADDDPYDRSDLRATVRAEVARLTPRERLIVDLRFREERTQSEIGEVLGVSQMQVSRLLAAILDRLGVALGARTAA